MLLSLLGAVAAGALTTLAPCSLTLLPVILGGSMQGAADSNAVRRVAVIALSLGASVFAFTMLLKASTLLIQIPPATWQWLSGAILVALGVAMTWPNLWDRLAWRASGSATSALSRAASGQGTWSAVLTGAALGPVFSSCSPLYAYVVVTVLPSDLATGLALLTAYVFGLVAVLLTVGLLGQRAVRRLGWAADPHGRLKRLLGLMFVVLGVLIATGLMKQIEAWVLVNSPIAPWEWVQ